MKRADEHDLGFQHICSISIAAAYLYAHQFMVMIILIFFTQDGRMSE
jgi:hypothetical protein